MNGMVFLDELVVKVKSLAKVRIERRKYPTKSSILWSPEIDAGLFLNFDDIVIIFFGSAV